MKLIDSYDALVSRGEIENDFLQREVLEHFQRLHDELKNSSCPWYKPWCKRVIKGVFLYGPVGVGKTYLVDLFYQNLQTEKKARFHFHHFMQQIDLKLRQLQGLKDPLRHIAKEIAQTTRVLCFDEFLVHDVAYAMILAELFQALYNYGVILVISSNAKPDDLYLNGVHRERFLPAIALIKQNCEVLPLFEKRDYRVGREPLTNAYLYPLNKSTQERIEQQFTALARDEKIDGVIRIQNRDIFYIKYSHKCIWFAFEVLCNPPRSQLDYLELAERFDTIFLSDIPRLTEKHTLQTIMFIHFIDVMYDRGVKVIMSAAVPIEELYPAGEMKDTFKRTLSRLMEMQSVDYLSRHPRRTYQKIKSV